MIDITILTQPSCSFCERAQAILSRLVLEFPLNITEVGLDTDTGRELAVKHGIMFAPGILINKKLFSYGRLSEKKLVKRLSEISD